MEVMLILVALGQESGKAVEASPAPAPPVEAVRSPVTGPKPPAGRTVQKRWLGTCSSAKSVVDLYEFVSKFQGHLMPY